MTQGIETGLNSLKDYLMFLATTIIQFIHMLFNDPIMAIKTPEHLFVLGHIILGLGLLLPSWG